MRIRRDFSISEQTMEVSLTIGFFDGVHLGHRRIIEEVIRKANLEDVQSCVVTFDRHPTEFFSGRRMKLLTSWEEKEEIIRMLGMDLIHIFTFNSRFASLSPKEFLQKLNEIFNINEIMVGEEFTFGKRGEGNVNFLYQKRSQFGYRLKAIPCAKLNGKKISSSLLRKWLKEGEIEKVARGLGRYPTITGRVITGRGKGREIGCPTANLQPDPQKLLPPSGVYAGYAQVKEKMYKALVNVGGRPTFGDFTPGIEVHLIDFEDRLYHEMLRIDMVERIRDIHFFLSPVHLSRQLEKDKEKAKKILKDYTFLSKGS